MSSHRSHSRTGAKIIESEGNENDFEDHSYPIPFPPPRAPLITIPDPAQTQSEAQENELDSSRVKFEGSSRIPRVSDRKTEAWSGTPRGGVRGKLHSEPSSAQSTPAARRGSIGVGAGACTGARQIRDSGARGGGSSKVCRGISIAPSEAFTEVPHFELVEDSSFWMDHNVQVLIRIRPLNVSEKTWQGNFSCLRQESAQSLTWLGNPETRFTFDNVACETISQEKLFMVAGLPMVENCMSGYNSCMFAYGQTGSGKTYTMMGEIHEMDGKLNEDCGMTPRMFEYLFRRIRSEEENRRDEKLKYSCKCSFLEIYNEQITDLLEPSSNNLQLREDMRKGVYVENLTEYEVTTVKDVVRLLLQGAANRKVAATDMNSESSRSHSVFTCVIESRRDLDSTTHFRFGRLNLVDLAGSERQKSSGAEGERLKEAANINKSLSTLGLVIMTLVDVAHGKHRHVPYRDSRLTFLLQDSLGGNSKTTIIANISPSACSANETLSTLKFAQRAKLIQNNAKVNEDASGDVMALQHQIQQLKDQLTFLLEHPEISRTTLPGLPHLEPTQFGESHETYESSWTERTPSYQFRTTFAEKKMKSVETTLSGALRREKMAETAVAKLEAEIEHMNRLVHQREEDAQRTKMILRFREEKIKRLELLVDGLVSADEYLIEETSALSEEIQLLQAKIDRNPELTRFALENIRLIEQLRMFEDFYERGERQILLSEVSELRDQLMEILEEKHGQLEFSAQTKTQDRDSAKELENCRRDLDVCLELNENLTREADDLRDKLDKYLNSSEAAFNSVASSLSRGETIAPSDIHSSANVSETPSMQPSEVAEKIGDTSSIQPSETEKELTNARLLIEAMESEQVRLIEELENLQKENFQHLELLTIQDSKQMQSVYQHETHCEGSRAYQKHKETKPRVEDKGGIAISALQTKLDRMSRDLQEARRVNRRYQDDQASQMSHQNEVEQVCQQVEVEMATTIIQLQDELSSLQRELQEKLCFMNDENSRLRTTLAFKENEIKALSEEWEKATLDLTSFLADGCRSLEDASDQIQNIASSFPETKVWVSKHVEKAAKIFVEKEKTVEQLRDSLEDAQKLGLEMELKLSSLKGATLVMTEVQQLENEENNRETIQLQTLLHEKISLIHELENKLKIKEDQIVDAERRAEAAFVVIKTLSDYPEVAQERIDSKGIPELSMVPNIRDQLRETNNRLNSIRASIEAVLAENDFSAVAGDCKIKEITSVGCFASCSNDMTDATILRLTEEVELAFNSFLRIRTHMANLVHNKNMDIHSYEQGSCFNEPSTLGVRSQLDMNPKEGSVQLALLEMDQRLQSFESRMEEAEEGCDTTELLRLKLDSARLVDDEKIHTASSILDKFEEAQETMKEADVMLNTLVKANEKAKYMTDKWKQVGEELKLEKACLLEEVQQLTNSICLQEGEYEALKEQFHSSLVELTNSVASLEGSFLQMQRDVEERFKLIYSDISSLVKDVLNCIGHSKSSVEDIWSKIMEKGFALFVQYQCQIGACFERFSCLNSKPFLLQYRQKECHSIRSNVGERCLKEEADENEGLEYKVSYPDDYVDLKYSLEKVVNGKDLGRTTDDLIFENSSLKKELARKESLLKGTIFDLSLLQESISNSKDVKDETERMVATLGKVQDALAEKTCQLGNVLDQQVKLEAQLTDSEAALFIANAKLEQAEKAHDLLTKQNVEIRVLVENLRDETNEAEEQLKEKNEVIRSLENEILRMSVTAEKKIFSSIEDIEDELRSVTSERDHLLNEVISLNDKLEMANALVDENEAIAVEARQQSEASKLYAEEKEEEAKILENSVGELESTINVLEKKIDELGEEVERQRLMRDDLKLELQALRQRMVTVENATEYTDSEYCNGELQNEDQILRHNDNPVMELHKSMNRIRALEKERQEQEKEIKECRDYISELVLHAEAQASQYQQKYKMLENMVREAKTDPSTSISAASTLDKTEKSSRTRGSSSPFRCISGLVQQMNVEKDQELSVARVRVEELEALASRQQKEVCMLNARLAASESMTHDVIRDLLAVKLDLTNYADMIDQHQVQKLVEEAQQQTEEFIAKEQEILKLREQIDDLIEEVNQREADILTAELTVEQLRQRDQMLTAQNEMLKMDKNNLKKKMTEMDEMVRKQRGSQSSQQRVLQQTKMKENSFPRVGDEELTKRLSHSEKLLCDMNNEIAWYRKSHSRDPHSQNDEQRFRRKRQEAGSEFE